MGFLYLLLAYSIHGCKSWLSRHPDGPVVPGRSWCRSWPPGGGSQTNAESCGHWPVWSNQPGRRQFSLLSGDCFHGYDAVRLFPLGKRQGGCWPILVFPGLVLLFSPHPPFPSISGISETGYKTVEGMSRTFRCPQWNVKLNFTLFNSFLFINSVCSSYPRRRVSRLVPAKAGNDTKKDGFLFPQETLDSRFHGNDILINL